MNCVVPPDRVLSTQLKQLFIFCDSTCARPSLTTVFNWKESEIEWFSLTTNFTRSIIEQCHAKTWPVFVECTSTSLPTNDNAPRICSKLFSRESANKRTDGQTDATNCIISPGSRPITMICGLVLAMHSSCITFPFTRVQCTDLSWGVCRGRRLC